MTSGNEINELAREVAGAPAIEVSALVEPLEIADLVVTVHGEETLTEEEQRDALALVLAEFVPRIRRAAADWLAGDAEARGLSVRVGL